MNVPEDPANKNNFECFIFDFDGTLACSDQAYREAFRHAILVHTGIEVQDHEFPGFWNITPEEILSKYSPDLTGVMMRSFEVYYYTNHHNHLVAFSGVSELLHECERRGLKVGVVSLKPRQAGELELDITGLRPWVEIAIWGDDVINPKPDPEGVATMVRRFNSDVSRVLVIGDSPADIVMGRAAGAKTAAAMWGGPDRDRIIAENPDFILESPADLLRLLS